MSNPQDEGATLRFIDASRAIRDQPTDNELEDILQIELKDAGTQVFKLIDVNEALTALRQREAKLLATLQTAVLAAAPEKKRSGSKTELHTKRLGGYTEEGEPIFTPFKSIVTVDSAADGFNQAIDQYTTAIKQLFESKD